MTPPLQVQPAVDVAVVGGLPSPIIAANSSSNTAKHSVDAAVAVRVASARPLP